MSDDDLCWENHVWLGAIEQADRGDTGPLIELLRSETALPATSRRLLADLLERHVLTKRRGRQKTPAYRLSEADAALQCAAEEVRADVRAPQGLRADDTLKHIAADYGVKTRTLRNHIAGKRGASRRKP